MLALRKKVLIPLSILLLSAILLSQVSYVKCKLEYQITESYINVIGPNFEVHVSPAGGLVGYFVGGVQALEKASIFIWGPGYKYNKFIVDYFTPVEDPKIEEIEGGLRIITHSKCNLPQYSLFLECITVHEIYESGVVIINHTLSAWKDTSYEKMASRIRLSVDMYGGAKLIGYKGGKKVLELELPKEFKGGGYYLAKGSYSILSVSIPGTQVSLLFISFEPPLPKRVEIGDDRKYGANYFSVRVRVSGYTFPSSGMKEGYKGVIAYLIFPHMLGKEFNDKAISVLQKQASVYDYISKVKEIAKSEKAKEYIAKAEELARDVLKAICMGNIDTALKYAEDAYNYAEKAYRTESTMVGVRYIIIPLIAYFVIIFLVIRRWSKRYKAIEGKS